MRCFLFSLLILASPGAISWYQELGSEVSGVVAYDTTGRQPILVAFNRTENCQFASLWLDGSLRDQDLPDKSLLTKAVLKVDNRPGWPLSLDYTKTNYWLPGFWVLKQTIPLSIIRQLRKGHLLTISVGKDEYSWNLAGSSTAMRSAYNACK